MPTHTPATHPSTNPSATLELDRGYIADVVQTVSLGLLDMEAGEEKVSHYHLQLATNFIDTEGIPYEAERVRLQEERRHIEQEIEERENRLDFVPQTTEQTTTTSTHQWDGFSKTTFIFTIFAYAALTTYGVVNVALWLKQNRMEYMLDTSWTSTIAAVVMGLAMVLSSYGGKCVYYLLRPVWQKVFFLACTFGFFVSFFSWLSLLSITTIQPEPDPTTLLETGEEWINGQRLTFITQVAWEWFLGSLILIYLQQVWEKSKTTTQVVSTIPNPAYTALKHEREQLREDLAENKKSIVFIDQYFAVQGQSTSAFAERATALYYHLLAQSHQPLHQIKRRRA